MKRKVLSRRRKLESIGTETTSSGSPFQIRGPTEQLTTSVHNTVRNSSANLATYFRAAIIAQLLSIEGEGGLMPAFRGA